jgi:hypothetical protein
MAMASARRNVSPCRGPLSDRPMRVRDVREDVDGVDLLDQVFDDCGPLGVI